MGAKYVFNPLTGNLDTTDVVAFNGEVNLGTAAAPSVFFTGDSNTGIYSPGADQVAISTNGAGALFIDASGKVGVGGAPSEKLDVVGSLDVKAAIQSTGTGSSANASLRIKTAEYNWLIQAGGSTDGGIRFYQSTTGIDTERLRITSTGELKHIGGGSEGSPGVYFSGSAPSNSLYVQATTGNVGLGTSSPTSELTIFHETDPEINFNINVHGTAGKFRADADGLSIFGEGSTKQLRFLTNSTRAMTIDSSQRVGIGTTSPSSLLHLADAGDITVGTTTGTKIGTATSQKIGFYNATPVVQPTTSVAEAAFVENSGGTAVNVDSTFGGYTIQQVVEALQTLGLLA